MVYIHLQMHYHIVLALDSFVQKNVTDIAHFKETKYQHNLSSIAKILYLSTLIKNLCRIYSGPIKVLNRLGCFDHGEPFAAR